MLHIVYHIKHLAEHFQSLLKVFQMFKISSWYDDNIGLEDVPDFLGIMCISCGKVLVVHYTITL